ncbi:MAG: hypothetical protein JWL65_5729 [Gammaproteobacteria bacterium]|nr:hypothetical protein [Gammaproteobacteria bacterium]
MMVFFAMRLSCTRIRGAFAGQNVNRTRPHQGSGAEDGWENLPEKPGWFVAKNKSAHAGDSKVPGLFGVARHSG